MDRAALAHHEAGHATNPLKLGGAIDEVRIHQMEPA
jgi:hypothetical protein